LTTTRAAQNVPPPQEAQPVSQVPLPTGHDLTERDLEMARKTAEIMREQQLYAMRPKKKFFSASTQEYEYAPYIRKYAMRLERVGNLNFPDEVRRRNLSGSVIVAVEINRNGSIAGITVSGPSGIPALDHAAVHTVQLAAPFPELPRTKDNPDIISITRTFRFLPGTGAIEVKK
jgi:protein TonB